jgi:hypothetical protein
MLKRPIFILLFLLPLLTLHAQKRVQKQWNTAAIDTLWIDSDVVFKVQISSATEETIDLITSIEGEYYESVVVHSRILGRTLKVDTGFSPFFSPKNDKLAAHKVLSIEMTLRIPSNLAVVVRSKTASVYVEGNLSFLETILGEGQCDLSQFIGNAQLYSVSGDITVAALPNVGGRALSKGGKVQNDLSLEGTYFIEAESVRGSVRLLRSQ